MSLKSERKKKNYSTSKLSEISGVSRRSIEDFECNHRNINNSTLGILCKLAIALDCTPFEILTDEKLKAKLKLALKLSD